MAKFLTKRTQFQCVVNPAVMFTISASGNVSHQNSTVLTTSAKLSHSAAICPILTLAAQGTPQQCKFRQTAWIAYDLTRKANGKNLLTDNSFCTCPIGSIVKVRAALAMGFQSGNFSAQVADSVTPDTNSPENIAANVSNFAQDVQDILKTSTNNLQNISANDSKSTQNKQENSQPTTKVTEKYEYVLQCLECDKKACKYRKDKFNAFSDEIYKSSAVLTEKYIQYLATTGRFNAADNAYRKSLLDWKGAWSHQAHHIIPANEAFAQVPELVRVANACGYDINCAENCIMLVSKLEGHGQLSDDDKEKSAFEIMALTGMQWHLGEHRGTEYSRRVQAALEKIKIPEKICPKDIITAINNVSFRVRNKLAAFGNNPMASRPYYVSTVALNYALAPYWQRLFATVRGGVKHFGRRYIQGKTYSSNKARKNAQRISRTREE